MSAEERQQVATALAVMVQEWGSGDWGRSADAVRGCIHLAALRPFVRY
jgi:hypothetical protein